MKRRHSHPEEAIKEALLPLLKPEKADAYNDLYHLLTALGGLLATEGILTGAVTVEQAQEMTLETWRASTEKLGIEVEF